MENTSNVEKGSTVVPKSERHSNEKSHSTAERFRSNGLSVTSILALNCKLLVIGLLGGLGTETIRAGIQITNISLGTYFPWKSSLWKIDTVNRQPVTIIQSTPTNRITAILLNWPIHMGVDIIFFTLLCWGYFGKHTPKWALFCYTVSCLSLQLLLLGLYNIIPYFSIGPPVQSVILSLCLYIFLPSSCKVPFIFLMQSFIIFVGFLMLQSVQHIQQTENIVLLNYIVIYPLCREITRYLSMRCSWALTSKSALEKETLIKPNHFYAYAASSYLFFFWGIFYRLQVANIEDIGYRYAITLWQSFIEITGRLSLPWREAKLVQISKALGFNKNRKTKVGSLLDIGELKVKIEKEADARNIYLATHLLLETLGEYCGIGFAFCTIWRHQFTFLFEPFPFYNRESAFRHQNKNSFEPLFMNMILQIVSEFIVDGICFFYEARRGGANYAEIVKFATSKKRVIPGFFISLLLASEFALGVTQGGVYDFTACEGRNMCYCMNNGIAEDTIWYKYCVYVYGDNSTFFNISMIP